MLLEKTDSYLVYRLGLHLTIVTARDGNTMIAVKNIPHLEPDIRVYNTMHIPCDGHIKCISTPEATDLFKRECGIDYHGSHLIPF